VVVVAPVTRIRPALRTPPRNQAPGGPRNPPSAISI